MAKPFHLRHLQLDMESRTKMTLTRDEVEGKQFAEANNIGGGGVYTDGAGSRRHMRRKLNGTKTD